MARREYTFTLVLDGDIKTFNALDDVSGTYTIVKYDELNSKVYLEMDDDTVHNVIKSKAEEWKVLAEGEKSKAV